MDYDFMGLPNQAQTMDLVNMVLQMEKHFPSEFHHYPQSVIDFTSGGGSTAPHPMTSSYPPSAAASLLQAPPNSDLYTTLGLGGTPPGGGADAAAGLDGEDGGGSSPNSKRAASMAAMREMIFRIAAMQPVHIDPESVKAPKRRNVRISKDPQSVAARHRRERISERIRILQRLVPGGTKMDTASMLDEAIHYVKFLKDQVQSLEKVATSGGPHPWIQQHVMAGGRGFGAPLPTPGSCASSGNSSPLSSATSSPPHYSPGGGANTSSDLNTNIYHHHHHHPQYVAAAADDMYHHPHHQYDDQQQYINSTAYMFK